MLFENGVYRAVVKDISIYLRGDNNRLTAAFRLECEGKELLHREWVELNDGTISDRTIKRMRDCFAEWDGSIEALEQGFCVKDVEVDVTVENEQDRDDPEKWWTRTRYMDPPGGGNSPAAMPEAETRATLVSKYGARFRALAGGAPAGGGRKTEVGGQRAEVGGVKTEVGGQTSVGSGAPPPASRPPVKAGGVIAETSTLEECWEALCSAHPNEMREQVTERWFAILEQVAPSMDQAEFEPADWGKVMAEATLPF
jgi:hypothetical protein